MTVADQIKTIEKLSKMKHSMISTEKQLRHLYSLLKTWTNMNI